MSLRSLNTTGQSGSFPFAPNTNQGLERFHRPTAGQSEPRPAPASLASPSEERDGAQHLGHAHSTDGAHTPRVSTWAARSFSRPRSSSGAGGGNGWARERGGGAGVTRSCSLVHLLACWFGYVSILTNWTYIHMQYAHVCLWIKYIDVSTHMHTHISIYLSACLSIYFSILSHFYIISVFLPIPTYIYPSNNLYLYVDKCT